MDATKRTKRSGRTERARIAAAGPRLRVAVTCDQSGDISAHLGNCTRLLLAEVEGEELVSSRTGELGPDGLRDGSLDSLEGCTHIICKGVGPRIAERLRSQGVMPYVVASPMQPLEAVEALLAGRLRPSGVFGDAGPAKAPVLPVGQPG